MDPVEAQTTAQAAWEQAWHGAWELAWREAPLPGSIIFEAWQTEAGRQRRYEILEADVPGLVGLVYVNDGQEATIFNRLDPTEPATHGGATLPFSPLTAAFQQVAALLAETPRSATQETISLPQGPGLQITLIYPQERRLVLRLDMTANLILQARVEAPATRFVLVARSLEPLTEPHPRLFERGP